LFKQRYINDNEIALAQYPSLLDNQEEMVIDVMSEEYEDDGKIPQREERSSRNIANLI
jgi:hypothetical protein